MSESHTKDHRRIEAYRKELEADPKSLVFVALAEALNRIGEFDQAADVAQRGLRSHKDSVAGRLALAVAEAGRGSIREALEQIKAALIIDQENPRALALMGSLLLQKGLARRAVQFLSQAVKLAPDTREYADLLRRARRLAKDESPVPLPVVRGDQVLDSDNPWTDDGGGTVDAGRPPARAPGENEHTVFDPDAMRVLGGPAAKPPRPARPASPARAPAGKPLEAEVTHFATPDELAGRRREPDAPIERIETGSERTTFDVRQIMDTPPPSPSPARRSKPKVGGSAAEYSRLIARHPLGAAAPQGMSDEYTVAAPADAFLETPTVDGVAGKDLERSDPLAALGDEGPPEPAEATVFDSTVPQKARKSGARPIPEAPSVVQARRASSAPPAPPPAEVMVPPSVRSAVAEAPPPPPPKAPSIRPQPPEPPPPPPPAADASQLAADSSIPADELVLARDPADLPSPPKSAVRKVEKPRKEDAPAKPPAEEPEAEKPKKAAKEPKPAPELSSGSGKPATMFVDDAVWAIYGAERPSPAPPRAEGEPAKPAHKAEKPAPQAGLRRRSVLVVRTSQHFGQATRWITLAVLAGVALWVGYSAAVARSGAAPTEAREELKGIAADLERGGLASLLAAEEAVDELLPLAPDLEPTLKGVLAEIHARTWSEFGRSPRALEHALTELQAAGRDDPSLEVLSARVALSTSARERSDLDRAIEKKLELYKDSPKAWVLRAEIARAGGRAQDALRALHQARSLHKKRRHTLLALARWHGRRGAHGAAFSYFSEIFEQQDLAEDVEAALDRFVLGQASGLDPAGSEAETRLAGLVREELPRVAKDEAGRVALAFSAAMFGRGDLAGGLEQLARAESAFEESAVFKAAVGGVLLAAGEWTRAREQYERALKLAPDDDALRIGIARARYGEQAGLRREDGAQKGARAQLPFGTVRFVFGEFVPVAVEPSPRVFPEAGYAAAAAAAKGADLERALEAENLLALAARKTESGKPKSAIKLLEQARALRADAVVEIALGKAYLDRRDLDAARLSFKEALRLDPQSPAARHHLGAVLAEQGAVIEAIDTLEPLTRDGMIAPEAFRLLAELKHQRGDDSGAFDLLERVLSTSPRDGDLLLRIGRLHHHRKKPDEALGFYRRALEAEPDLAELPRRRDRDKDDRNGIDLYYLGRVLSERDEKEGTRVLFASTRLDDAPAEAHFYLGRSLVKQKRTKRAGRRALELYLKAAPDGPLSLQAERMLKGR